MSDERPLDLVSAALVECQGKIKGAKMDATNPFFKSRYATLGAIIEATRDALYGAGLAMQQILTVHDGLVTVQTIIRHKSGQWLDGGTLSLPIGESERNSDTQIAGSIATYLKRYSWASNLGVYSDEDDDGNTGPKGAIPRKTALNASGAPAPPSDTTKTNKVAPGASQSVQQALPDENKEKWAKIRLKFLNKLEAAPGQRNRVLLTDYLTSESILTLKQTLDELPFKAIPTTPEAFDKLLSGMQAFDMQRNEGQQ